jgi:hypothetical protein
VAHKQKEFKSKWKKKETLELRSLKKALILQ